MSDFKQTHRRQRVPTSTFAIASFSCALIALLLLLLRILFNLPSEEGAFFAVSMSLLISCWVVSFIAGYLAIRQIKRSAQPLGGKMLSNVGVTISFLMLISGFILSAFYRWPAPPQLVCSANLSNLGKAFILYTREHDDKYPTPQKWCDLILDGGYEAKESFVCPENKDARCSYALNPHVQPISDPDLVLLFETDGGWNQYGGSELLSTKNHDGEGCNILFNDSHVDFILAGQIKDLKWTDEEPNKVELGQ